MTSQQAADDVSPPLVSNPTSSSHQDHIISNSTTPSILLPLEVNCSVVLLSVTDPSKIVAKGYLNSMNPTKIVGGEELGKNWCSVHIIVGVECDERLIRSSFMLQTIGEANGAVVAWPCNLVCSMCLLLNFYNLL
ncbi:hypothetical protein CDL12_03499 [Handroanthus impetiginosus]|uniref:Transposase Tnp1/En/Spm-like domain-containing protein n=1 Tax=Handroanthus impetiginosus TaxID=429701 RepID=A0A2G9I1Z9_9LAMI|nr:hypothetical protein CDL12_03499 [Handroanthus impetiginosus]